MKSFKAPRLPSDPAQLAAAVQDAMHSMEQAAHRAIPYEEWETLHTEPSKLRAGMFALADGTDWDPGEGEGMYRYTGSAWVKLIEASDVPAAMLSDYQEFTSSGTWTKPAGATWVRVEVIGSGGGGANHTSTTSSGGGGGGGYNERLFLASELTSPVTVTIGAVGSGGANGGNNNGGNAADATFGAYLTGPGGKGGTTALGASARNAGRSGSGARGGCQATGHADGEGSGSGGGGGAGTGAGGDAVTGGGGGGGSASSAGAGGSSSRAGAGGAGVATAATPGGTGTAPGGGGGASTNDGGGGPGALGRIRVWSW